MYLSVYYVTKNSLLLGKYYNSRRSMLDKILQIATDDLALYQPELYPQKIDGRIQFFAPTQRMPPLPENAIVLGSDGFDQSEYVNREDLGLNIQTIRDVVNGQPDDEAINAFIARGNEINEEERQNQLTNNRLLEIEQELHNLFSEDQNEPESL